MENVHTSPEGSGERHLPGYFGSHDKQAAWFSDDHTHRHFWSPVCFSSSSASTEYWSTHTSPFAAPRARLSLSDKDVSSETSHLTRTATNGEKFNDPPQSAGTHTLGWSSDAVSFSALDVRSFSGLDPLLDDFCFPKSLPDASWSPVCLSSPSASTEYSSFNPTPRASLPTLVAHLPQTSPDNQIGENPRKLDATNAAFHVPSLPDTSTWCEKLPWSEPLLLEGCTTRHCESSISSEDYVVEDGSCIEPTLETPDEHVEFLSQDQVDKNVREMTCGPRLEEHFWPIRYKIRSGTLQLYENTLHALIIQARKELHPAMHGRLSKLTDESAASHAIETSSSSLTWFLDGSRNLYERLWQIADELRATELQQFKEAVWKDSLIIILVLYEILTSKTDLEHIMKLRGIKAQFMLDLMQDTIRTHIDLVDLRRGGAPRIRGVRRIFLRNIIDLGLLQNVDRPSAQLDVRRLIVQLSEVSDLLPSSLTIHGVQNTSPMPLAGGNFGDIYTAQYQGGTVALKRLRLFQAESDESLRIRRKFCREALIWKNLDHDYVLPFLGVDSNTFPGFLCMVSPWMSKGALVTSKGGPPEDSIPVLVYEIAVGLQYLHSQNIVHGDLRGANILLDDLGHARLADFGLAVVTDGPLAPTNCGGSLRWMAPELLHPGSCGLNDFQRTFASDIYSFACVCLELYTGKPPFSELLADGAVLLGVVAGDRPAYPSIMPGWCRQLVGKSWSQSPFNRPGIGTIIELVVQSIRKRRRPLQDVDLLDAPLEKRPKIV